MENLIRGQGLSEANISESSSDIDKQLMEVLFGESDKADIQNLLRTLTMGVEGNEFRIRILEQIFTKICKNISIQEIESFIDFTEFRGNSSAKKVVETLVENLDDDKKKYILSKLS